jgi:glycosyltransferase involved in cell wall biosynthesis
MALVESPDHVCCRYRIAAFRPHLERTGHSLELRSFPTKLWQWVTLFRDIAKADCVILQRKLLFGWRLAWIRRAAKQLIYDFDDAVFQRDSFTRKGSLCERRRRRFAAICRLADVVIAGNHFLGEQAAQYTASERIAMVPTCVDPTRYRAAKHDGRNAQLVWIGSRSVLQGLERIRPLLETIGERLPGLELKLICDASLRFDQLRVVPCLWSEASEGGDLATAGIGIAWIPDDSWGKGKCGLKVLQYMAAGLPVVANAVGVQVEMVRHGENGFIADTPEEWVRAIGRLVNDPSLRRRMGDAGRRMVAQRYSVDVGGDRWVEILNGLEKRRQAA